MKYRKILLYYILFTVVLIFCNCNDHRTIALDGRACGIIERKYRDWKNHGAQTFDIREYDKSHFFFADYYPGSWMYASIGDSIIKNKGETFITIKKVSGESKLFDTRLK